MSSKQLPRKASQLSVMDITIRLPSTANTPSFFLHSGYFLTFIIFPNWWIVLYVRKWQRMQSQREKDGGLKTYNIIFSWQKGCLGLISSFCTSLYRILGPFLVHLHLYAMRKKQAVWIQNGYRNTFKISVSEEKKTSLK